MTRQPAKRQAIVAGAGAVFAEYGYMRASTQHIAAAAGVSTRTLYNHFPGKEALFHAVLVEGATQIADAFETALAVIDGDRDAETTVTRIAYALVAHRTDFPAHFAISDRLGAEAQHFPPGLLDAWRAAGPERVERAVACHLSRLAARGLLTLADPAEAAYQLILLIAGAIAFQQRPGTRMARRGADAIVTSGVHTFLYGYRASAEPPMAAPAAIDAR